MTAAFGRVVVGNGLDDRVTLGPVISAAAARRAGALIESAADAQVIRGGTITDEAEFRAGHFVRPTLIVDADQRSAVVQEEQFAPILPVIGFDDDEAAVAMANDNAYGLGGSVWSADTDRAAALADRLDVGIAIVNGTAFDTKDLRTPFGGVNQSGIGRMLAAAGLDAYSAEFVRVHGDLDQAPDLLIGR